MKRLIYFNKPMNIIVVIIREYTKKVERSLDEATPPPPPRNALHASWKNRKNARSPTSHKIVLHA